MYAKPPSLPSLSVKWVFIPENGVSAHLNTPLLLALPVGRSHGFCPHLLSSQPSGLVQTDGALLDKSHDKPS